MRATKLKIWDIDNCLYPYDAAFWGMVCDAAARAAVTVSQGKIDYALALPLAEQSQKEFKKATAIFVRDFQLDSDALFKEFLGNLNYDFLKRSHALQQGMRETGAMHVALTSNSAERGCKILKARGLSRLITPDDVISVTDMKLQAKNEGPGAYEYVLARKRVSPEEATMTDDLYDNLPPAKKLGIQTVWVQQDQKEPESLVDADYTFKNPEAFLRHYNARHGQKASVRGQAAA